MRRFNRLGQHFLESQAAIRTIVSALRLQRGDCVIEIGPGMGALTTPLARACGEIGCRIIAIEKDPQLAKRLEIRSEKLEIICGDALKVFPNLTSNLKPLTSYKLVGNIPYYITGRLFRILSELPNKPQCSVFTIQREVAERIAAKPPRMSLLSAITQTWAKPKIISFLNPEDFSPAPKVRSAIIALEKRTPAEANEEEINSLYGFFRIVFKQPRKTILNNVRFGLNLDAETALKTLTKTGLTGSERPQNLSLAVLIKLARAFHKNTVV